MIARIRVRITLQFLPNLFRINHCQNRRSRRDGCELALVHLAASLTPGANRIFDQLPDLGIESVLTLEWWYCPVCAGVAYEGLCGHRDEKQDLAGTLIRSIIQGGEEPSPTTLRREILEIVRECADQYGFGSPFVAEHYLENRTPVMSMPVLECTACTCTCSCTCSGT